MATITTYPNKFNTDSITIDSDLLYNFNISYDVTISGEGNIPGSKYFSTSVLNEYQNVKFNNIIYTFKGLYLTKNKDIVDENNLDNNNYSYVLIIECINYNLDKRLYISLPLYESSNDTTINNIFKASNNYTIENINTFIPIDQGFYNYKTSGIIDKFSEMILYTKSNLSMKYDITINDSPQVTEVLVPLSISKNPASKVNYISNNTYDNDIYIDCQPVDEKEQETNVKIYSSLEKTYKLTFETIYYYFIYFLNNIIPAMIPFIFIFGLLYIILYYKIKL